MNNATLLSTMVAATPAIRSHSAIRTIAPSDSEIIEAQRYDDSWRQFPQKYYNTPVSRKGGLSNFIPLRTNGVIVLGKLLNGTMATAHLTNLEIETLPGFLFTRPKKEKKTRTRKPTTELDLDLL